MKAAKRSLILILLLISRLSFCDIIPENSHAVTKCVKITNVDDFKDISLLGHVVGISPSMAFPTYVVTPTSCLAKGYKFNTLNIFAVAKSYLADKNIATIDWAKDNNAIKSSVAIESFGGFLHNSNPILAIDQYYRIVGFSKSEVVLYKWKEVNRFNNGKPDSIKTYAYNGDSTLLSRNFSSVVNLILENASVELYPNPATKSINFRISNNYVGMISVKIHSIDGKTVKSVTIEKSKTLLEHNIDLGNISSNIYLVDILMGTKVEVKRMVIK